MSLIVVGVALPWLVVTLFITLGAWIGFQLIQQNGRLLSRLDGLEQRLSQMSLPAVPLPSPAPAPAPAPAPTTGLQPGAPGPAFELPDLDGSRKSLADFRGKKLLLVFFNPRCGFCTRMAPDLAALPVDGRDGRPIPLLVSTGDPEANRELAAEHGLRGPFLLQESMEVAAQYQCHGTPMGYLVDEEGRIASEMKVGADALLALARGSAPTTNGHAPAETNSHGSGALGGTRTLAESKIQRNGLPPGTPAPSFRLPRLGGGELSLEEFRGRKVLLVFADPKCGPCDALAPQLERASPDVQVLMVSRGDEEANRAKVAEHGLTFPITLQRQWEVSREYAMFGTPVGYLIDEDGTIAAEPASGAEPVLALLAKVRMLRAPERRCRCGKPLSECGKRDCGGGRQKATVTAAKPNGW